MKSFQHNRNDILFMNISVIILSFQINGQKKFLPVEENNKKLKIFRSGRFVQIWTECGVEVNFDGVHSVFVVTPAKYKGHLKGLCGDCNGKKDDFKTKNGKDVSKKKNKFALIGDSYSVTDDSDDPVTRLVPFNIDFHISLT